MENLKYRDVLSNLNTYFNEMHCGNVLAEGYFALGSNDALKSAYYDALSLGTDADTKAEMVQLFKNSDKEVLTEAYTSGLAPIYAMSNPLIRMLWPKIHLKEAVKTVVADSPRLLVDFIAPYIEKVTEDGKVKKYYIPYELDEARDAETGDIETSYVNFDVTVGSTNVATYDVWAQKGAALFGNIASRVKFQPLDSDFLFKSAVLTISEADKTVKVNMQPTPINGTMIYNYAVDAATGMIIVTVDYENDLVTVAHVSTAGNAVLKSASFRAHFTTENHERVTNMSIETMRDEVNIGTAEHFSATVPTEFLSDLKAMYKVEGLEEITTQMSKLVELQLDKRLAKFIQSCFKSQPGTNKYYKHLPDNSQRFAVFNAKSSATFHGLSREWRSELRTYIDDLSTRIEVSTYLEDGIYTVVCNPKDALLINNIDWKFRGGADIVDGVSVSYSVGTYTGLHTYKVISSPQMPQGYMYLLFLPTGDKQLTYCYYPYSFVMESNYRDPNHMNLPAIMCTKRDTTKSFLPAIACIQILNNGNNLTGSEAEVFDTYREFVPTKQVTSSTDTDFVETGSLPNAE